MPEHSELPKLITFDGEARSGKGTIVQAAKDALRDTYGHNVMLIDGGQVFRCLVVAATRDNVDIENPDSIDAFLADDEKAEACVQFVKNVYHMPKNERDALLYTNDVGVGSAKIGARPLSQSFKDELLKKWLRDARTEGFDIVLLDGRALDQTGTMLEHAGLCSFPINLYFTCDPEVGARRTLGFAGRSYDELTIEERAEVDLLVTQINARNEADRTRSTQPIVVPQNAPIFTLPDVDLSTEAHGRFTAIIDTSADMTKEAMSEPVIDLIVKHLS